MARSSATSIAVALAVTGCSVRAFVVHPPRPTAPGCATSEGRPCNALPQHHKQGGRGSAARPLESSFFSLDGISSFFSGIREHTTTLPQDPDADTADRTEQLTKAKDLYKWNTTNNPVGVPYLNDFPPAEQNPSLGWITDVAYNAARILLGTVRGQVGVGEIAEALSDPGRAKTFASRIGELIKDAKVNERPVDIDDYTDLHAFPIKKPSSVYDYEDDDAFARMRLQGPNCVVVEKCTQATRNKLKVLDTDPEYKALKRTVDSLMAAGKLVVVDQELIKDHVADPLDDDVVRYLSCSIALFEVIEDDLLPLKPIGIQLSQGKEATPIFTPTDGYNWMIAKASFEAADFIIHEVVSHLGNTHLVLEGALVGMYRNFPKEHPLHALMEPHLEGTALINWGAQELLMAEGGGVDRLVANRIEDCWDLASTQTLKRLSSDFSPEADFTSRSMTKKDFPGRYMYRDIGLQYWEATHTWVKEYLSIYYKSDTDIEADWELTAFVDEMVTTGKVLWLKEFSTSSDKRGLIAKVIASWIYSASTLHAAVNFPQQYIQSYNPSNPASVYQPAPTDKKPRTFQQYLDYLPPMEIATSQVIVGTLLGSILYTKLGEYDSDQFTDDRVQVPLAKFQEAIQEIEDDLEIENGGLVQAAINKNKDKKDAKNFAYKTLLPDNVPQSINI